MYYPKKPLSLRAKDLPPKKPLLAIDFDGVLHSYKSGWMGPRIIPDPPVPGAMTFLINALAGFEVAIVSSRSRYFGGRRAMKRWLHHWLVEELWTFYGTAWRSILFTGGDIEEVIQYEAARTVRQLTFPLAKPPAHATIDDRALTFTGRWPDLQALYDFKPWNR